MTEIEKSGQGDEKPRKKRSKPSEILVNWEFCKGCWVCIKYCPANVFEKSKEMSPKGYHPPVVARPDDCISCSLCEFYCPDFAIWLKRK